MRGRGGEEREERSGCGDAEWGSRLLALCEPQWFLYMVEKETKKQKEEGDWEGGM